MTGPAAAHVGYWNAVLQEDFCRECGDNWPCWQYRRDHPRCRCSHARITHSTRTGYCWQTPCGCGEFRPEPIDRQVS